MGTELMRVCVKEENDDIPSVPPGFESFAAFTLTTVQHDEKQEIQNRTSCSASASASESQLCQMEMDSDICDASKTTRSRRHRPWINYGQLGDSSEDESDSGKLNQNISVTPHLPKGVIRGCPECKNCQKYFYYYHQRVSFQCNWCQAAGVIARWHPEYARRPDLEDAPVFYPTEEEFEDTLKYISSIRPKAESYGICRIVPPPSWKPPCPLKEKTIWECSTFATRVQRVDKLQNRDSMRKVSRIYNHTKKKRRRCGRMMGDCGIDSGSTSGPSDAGIHEAESFGFEPGPEFTLNTFQKYADNFKAQYFRKNDSLNKGDNMTIQDSSELTVENIEGEYWRIIEKATEEIEVLYGADLETGDFGSGFPKTSDGVSSAANDGYTKSGWNLNNFPRLPGSVLSYESGDISGVLVPWLYIGMCLSSFCWHVEDHHLYSLNYMHWGAPKIWYGVPGKDAVKLEEAMRKHLPDLFEEQPDLLHKLVTQLSPSILKSEGVPVYRCVQNSGEFVLTFPRAYHSGFNCGFNCAEAVNVAPVDWLPHGQIAIELYREQGRRTSISHDKLLLGAAREAVRAHWELNLLKKNTSDNLRWKEVCGKDGLLTKTLRTRVEMERVRREFLCSSSQAWKMDSNFDATNERECSVCLFDLHLSAAGCRFCPDKYGCLYHAKQLCSCNWGTKFFLFRYDISELYILTEALEGKLSAVYRWAKLDLGLALTSRVAKGDVQDCNLSYSPEIILLKDLSEEEISGDTKVAGTGTYVKTVPEEKKKPPQLSSLKDTGTSSKSPSSFNAIANENHKARESGISKPSRVDHDNIILLSDDESDEPQKEVAKKAIEISSAKHSDLSEKLSCSGDGLSNDNKSLMSTVSVKNATVMSGKNVTSLPDEQKNNSLSNAMQVKDECRQHCDSIPGSCLQNGASNIGSTNGGLGGNTQDFSNMLGNCKNNNMVTAGTQHPLPKPSNEDKMGSNVILNSVDNSRAMPGSPSCSQNNMDRCHRQKGPRIAKVVRRITCNVEPLEFGVVLSGNLWCNNHAIFPKGFKSRVRYINVLDPTNMCYYVSEILDAGLDGPLFMVSLEHCPSEVFIHVSAVRCWEMVRERVNLEITKLHKLGRTNLPPLQPPGSLDGLEMFGFSSPAIVQAIEASDRNRVCAGYWDSRPYSRPQGQIPQHSQSKENRARLREGISEKQDNREPPGTTHISSNRDDIILRGLFKKANPEELYSLSRVLSESNPVADQGFITQLLNEEIRKRPT